VRRPIALAAQYRQQIGRGGTLTLRGMGTDDGRDLFAFGSQTPASFLHALQQRVVDDVDGPFQLLIAADEQFAYFHVRLSIPS
jgi:hypothetical protein